MGVLRPCRIGWTGATSPALSLSLTSLQNKVDAAAVATNALVFGTTTSSVSVHQGYPGIAPIIEAVPSCFAPVGCREVAAARHPRPLVVVCMKRRVSLFNCCFCRCFCCCNYRRGRQRCCCCCHSAAVGSGSSMGGVEDVHVKTLCRRISRTQQRPINTWRKRHPLQFRDIAAHKQWHQVCAIHVARGW